jgi:integrase/recombinase XerC
MYKTGESDFVTATVRWLTATKKDYAPASTRAKHSAAAKFCAWSGDAGALADYNLPPIPPPSPKALPEGTEDVQRMIDGAPDEDSRCIIALQGLSGLRVGEVMALTVDDVDLQSNIATVCGKGARVRRVPISPGAVQHVAAAVERASAEGRKKLISYSVSTAKRRIPAAARGAGVGTGGTVHTHRLRATFATELYRETRDPLLCARLLGHSSVSNLNSYVELTDAQAAGAVAAVARRGAPA